MITINYKMISHKTTSMYNVENRYFLLLLLDFTGDLLPQKVKDFHDFSDTFSLNGG